MSGYMLLLPILGGFLVPNPKGSPNMGNWCANVPCSRSPKLNSWLVKEDANWITLDQTKQIEIDQHFIKENLN